MKYIYMLPFLAFITNLNPSFGQVEEFETLQISVERITAVNTEHLENSVNITEDGHFMTISRMQGRDFNLVLYYRSDINSNDWRIIGDFDGSINSMFSNEDYGEVKNGIILFEHWKSDWKEEVGGPFYVAKIEIDQSNLEVVSAPRPVGDAIRKFLVENGFDATDGMTLLEDNSIIFAAGAGYDSPMDIYYARHQGNWEYEYPSRLSISTEADERTPFVSRDNSTLYFASDRMEANGLDIYKVIFDETNTRSNTVERLSLAINTPDDEKGFVMYREDEAFFVKDMDIYRVTGVGLSTDGPSLPTPPVANPSETDSKEETEMDWVVHQDPIESNPSENIPTEKEIPPAEPQEVDITSKTTKIEFPKNNNLVFLLDISNTMDASNRFPLLKRTINAFLPHFRTEQDWISVITFNGNTSTLVNRATTRDQFSRIPRQLDKIKPSGSTYAFTALERALVPVSKYHIEGGNNVVVLCTDGYFKDQKKFNGLIRRYKRQKVKLVILCYGRPKKEVADELRGWAATTGGFFQVINEEIVDDAVLQALEGQARSLR